MKRIFSGNTTQLFVTISLTIKLARRASEALALLLIVLVTFNTNAGTTSDGNVFVVTGNVTDVNGDPAPAGLKVTVSNETLGLTKETTVESGGKYRVIFIDINTEEGDPDEGTVEVVADLGDTLKVEIRNADNSLWAISELRQITQADINVAMAVIDVQEIPVSPIVITAEITNPTSGQYARGILQIEGTVDVENGTLVRWQLYYAPGDPLIPQSLALLTGGPWEFLAESTALVNNGLLYEWDTTTINQVNPQGDQYSLYLRVTAKDNDEVTHYKNSNKVTFWVDNSKPEKPTIDATSNPGDHDNTTNNAILTVVGSVKEGGEEGSDDDLIIESIICPGMTSHDIQLIDTEISGTIQLGEVTGPVRVSIKVKDKASNISDPGRSNSLKADNTPPIVKIQQPAYNANFGSNSFTISGVALDSISGVAKVEIYIVGDKPGGVEKWTKVTGTENWNFEYNPSHQYPGEFDSESTCRVRATDIVGNVSEVVSNISETCEVSEIFVRYYSYHPLINLSNPIDCEYLTGVVEIRGSASAAYTLRYVNEDDPDDNGEIAGFAPPITNGVIVQWDTSNLDGTYTLSLTIGEHEVKREHIQIGGIFWGDVNGYGEIDENDAYDVLRHVVGRSPVGFIAERADVSGDGNITAYDAALIFQHARGIIDRFPRESQ